MFGTFTVAFVTYFMILLSFGLYFYRRNKNAEDFIVGSRSLNYWVTAISAQSSDMGAYLFLAIPGAIFVNGLFECWMIFALVIGMWAAWQYIAPALRTQTERYGVLTLSSYFEKRFNDTTGKIRVITGIITLLFFVFYISSALVALGRVLESTFGLNYHVGIIISVGIAMLYTLIGGFVAVAWSDLFQGLFLLSMIIIVPFAAWKNINGINDIITTAQAYNVSLSLLPDFSWTTFGSIANLMLGWGLGYFGQPHILINFMGIDQVSKMRKAQYVGIVWQLIALTAAVAVGLIAIPFFNGHTPNPELVFVLMSKMLFHPLFAGFILCAILAATISTVNTQMLVSASIFSHDFYRQLINPHATSKQLLHISRFSVLIIPIISSVIAFNNSNSILALVNYAWSGLGSAFGPVLLCALYSSWVTRRGALAGIIAGGLVSALWPYINAAILPLIPGFTVSLATTYIVSRMTKK